MGQVGHWWDHVEGPPSMLLQEQHAHGPFLPFNSFVVKPKIQNQNEAPAAICTDIWEANLGSTWVVPLAPYWNRLQ